LREDLMVILRQALPRRGYPSNVFDVPKQTVQILQAACLPASAQHT
jgi:hypothetical protein